MQVETLRWQKNGGWNAAAGVTDAHLVIYFSERNVLEQENIYAQISKMYPHAQIVGGSTGGEIFGEEVTNHSLVLTAIKFNTVTVKASAVVGDDPDTSFQSGKELGQALTSEHLRYIFLLSDGLNVNGAELVRGLHSVVGSDVIITGGLAGDGADFKATCVGLNTHPSEKNIVAVGLYGDALHVQYGSVGGWATFGPERVVTKAEGNVLYEMDGAPALELYKKYLGDDAERLPASGLLFPLGIRENPDSDYTLVRTMVGIDEEKQSITFAGEIKVGSIARLMWANFEDLVDGAGEAAKQANGSGEHGDGVAILVSCIGRKLLMGASISDETQSVAQALHHVVPTIGFYSYGEICHDQSTGKCNLHNQTMTVTVLYEA
jgi:hypothetical protein